MKGVSELLAARLDGLLVGELDWPRLGDTELVRDLYCRSVLRLFFAFKTLEEIFFQNFGVDFLSTLVVIPSSFCWRCDPWHDYCNRNTWLDESHQVGFVAFRNFQAPPIVNRILKRNSPVCRLHQPVG